MSPSSIKFTVEISNYRFSNQLNQLQLVLLSSIDTSKNSNICSSKKFNRNNYSDYIKLSVGDHSLYGRFIKRAIIDSSIKSVTNRLLTDMNNIFSSGSSILFIGITIPFYKQGVIIDPDFKVLIDNRAINSNDENSICKTSTSKLTTTQLTGIIIGSVALASIITISVIYYLAKKKSNEKNEY